MFTLLGKYIHSTPHVKTTLGLCFGLGMIGMAFVYKRRKRYLRREKNLDEHLHIKLPQVIVINSPSDWLSVEKKFLALCHAKGVIGLDCEWVSKNYGSKRSLVSLLQLSTSYDLCLLIRIFKFPQEIPVSLKEILKSQKIIKVGISIAEDAQKLLTDYGLVVKGFLDLRYLVDCNPQLRKIERKGLQYLVKVMLDAEMDKALAIRCSDWEDNNLSPRQINYAASDAVGASLVFNALVHSHFDHWWCFREPSDWELLEKANLMCERYFDLPYRPLPNESSRGYGKLVSFTAPKKQSTKAYSSRSKPLYHNCQIHAPDGEPLCTCDIRKAQWYLDRGLGTLTCENPLTVQLNFEPAGRPILDNIYYIKEKINRCVVCGKEDDIIRKAVVPSEYRKYFPKLMKEHLSHDVLLLCVNCHVISNAHDGVLRQQLAEECGAPIGRLEDVKCKQDPELSKIKSAGRALLKAGASIPIERKTQLEEVLKAYYKVQLLNRCLLEKAANVENVFQNDEYLPHGSKVVRHQCQNAGLMNFETRWRQHFLDTMKPKYLPSMWSVNHNHERLALQVTENPVTDFDVTILGIPSNKQ